MVFNFKKETGTTLELTTEERRMLVMLLLTKAILNWLWEGWRKPNLPGMLYGQLYVNFYHLPNAEGHHGTCAVVMKKNVRPENLKLWGPFGYANHVSVWFKGKKRFLYQMDWGVAGEEHFTDNTELAALRSSIKEDEKIYLFGIRTIEGKFWWIFGPPQNFMLVPNS